MKRLNVIICVFQQDTAGATAGEQQEEPQQQDGHDHRTRLPAQLAFSFMHCQGVENLQCT